MSIDTSQFAGSSIVSPEFIQVSNKETIAAIYMAGNPQLGGRLPAHVISSAKSVDVISSSCERDGKKLGIHIFV